MDVFRLSNGLKVIYDRRRSETVAIEVHVGTGSDNEHKDIAGISHFLEHMLFEGTKTRTAKEISESIENLGGEINAATSNDRTFFYAKVPRSKVKTGLDIISDIIKNPLFDAKIMEKERNVVLEEIKMVNDQPLLYQWVLFEKNLFKKHPAKNPVYGRVDSVKSITKGQMESYYKKWYVPENMILSIVGDIKDLRKLVKEKFGDMESVKAADVKKVDEPKDVRPTVLHEKKDINQAYLLVGYKTVSRTHRDSFALDVLSAIFYKGISGRITEEIRVKRGLAYSVGSLHESKKDYGFFVFHLNCDRKNLELCKKIIFEELEKIGNMEKKELDEAKEHIIGRLILDYEDSHKRADDLAFWEFIKDAKLGDEYLSKIRKVSVADVISVRKRYLKKDNYTMITISK